MTKVIFAGGGTAGHIEPALAVARRWSEKHKQHQIRFLGTRAGLESTLIPAAGFEITYIPKVTAPRKIAPRTFLFPLSLIRALVSAIRAISGAELIVGFGGYVSAPAYLAAKLRRIPIVIHEANAKPGMANRLGSKLTPYCAVSHQVAQKTLKNSTLTGLPLKENIAQAFVVAQKDWLEARIQAKHKLGFEVSKPLIFVFGGSQGSEAINKVIAAAQGKIADLGVNILHGVGSQGALPESTSDYRAVSYISDIATAYLAADLIISRSGAVTCAEVNSLGRYALFIPLPIGNGEQNLNASSLVSQGRAEIMAQPLFNEEWLLHNIERLISASAKAPISGSGLDIEATNKIVELMESALSGGK